MSIKRVFIISHYTLFGHGLKSLLGEAAEFDIVGQEADLDQALEQIKKIQPDVVIVDSDEAAYGSMPAVLRILKENSGTRVVGLNLQNNRIYAYNSKQWVVKGVADLKQAIESDWPLSEKAEFRQQEAGQ